MSFDQALAFVLEREGGLIDDPADPGGLTNLGISQRAYPNLSPSDIRNLTPSTVGPIYKGDYWLKAGCDSLPPGMALIVFDSAVNCGVDRAVTWLHEHPRPDDYLWQRMDYYRKLVIQKPPMLKFLTGWLKRLILLRQAIGGMT